jgi:putative membrane protein
MGQIFSDAERERVNRAVQEGEAQIAAEILPVVARSSGRYDRAEDVVGLWLAGIAIAAVWWLFPSTSGEPGNWSAPAAIWQLVAMLVAGVVAFILGAIVASRLSGLRRLFTPRRQMLEEVNTQARVAFFDRRVHHTSGRSGLLLYVSLYEHKAAVIADRGILDKLGQERIDQLCREFTQRLHDGTPADALCDTIRSVAQQLAPVLPRTEGATNDIADALIEIE